MGKRQDALMSLLGSHARKSVLEKASTAWLPAGARAEILELFKNLGGMPGHSEFRAGPWDLTFRNYIQLELDEEQHFNRYRQMVLQSSWASVLPWREAYLRHCEKFEPRCLLKAGNRGYWTSDSTVNMFGPSDAPKIFGQYGSARWKQRAFYDAIRDMCAIHVDGITVARVSIYDQVDGISLQDILDGRAGVKATRLHELIEARIFGQAILEGKSAVRDDPNERSGTQAPGKADLTVSETATRIGRHATTTRDLAHRGFFPNAYRVSDHPRARIKIPEADVASFLAIYGDTSVHGHKKGFRL